jgi:hypothetical protein
MLNECLSTALRKIVAFLNAEERKVNAKVRRVLPIFIRYVFSINGMLY